MPEIIEDSVVTLKKNKHLCYVGYVVRIKYQCNGGDGAEGRFHRTDYVKYMGGKSDHDFIA